MMHTEKFRGRSIMGMCDSELNVFWCILNMLNDTMGAEHIIRKDGRLLKKWLDLVNAVDDAYSQCFFDVGAVGECITLMLSDESDTSVLSSEAGNNSGDMSEQSG